MRNVMMTAMAIVAAATVASSANAASVVWDGNYAEIGASFSGATTFSNTYEFTLPSLSSFSGGLVAANVTALGGITFTSVTFEGVALNYLKFGANQYFDLPETLLGSGTYSLVVEGFTGAKGGRFDGNFAYSPVDDGGNPGGAVPEPISWAMMVGGFGLVGGAMRANRRQKVAINFA